MLSQFKTLTLLTASQLVLWATLIACVVIETEVFRSGEVFSKYAALESTMWIYIIGLSIASILLLLVTSRLSMQYKFFKASLYVVAVATMLTLVFRIDNGNVSFHIHRWLSVAIFLGISSGVGYITAKHKNAIHGIFCVLITIGFLLLVLSSGVVNAVDLLLFSEMIILISYTFWLQYLFRTQGDLLEEQ